MRWFLPKLIDTVNKDDGGPYKQNIPLGGKYIYLNEGRADKELIEVVAIEANYYVESFSDEVILHGEEVVELILKDFQSDNVEHVQRK